MSSEDSEREFIRALMRGLKVIECFDADHRRLSLSEVAKRSGLSRGTARRILMTLETMGYVATGNGVSWLTPRTLRLGYAYLSSEPLWTQSRPYLEALNQKLAETCSIAVLDGWEIVFVARVAAKRLTQDYIPIGFRWPAYATSLGKVLLSSLSEEEFERYLTETKLEELTQYTITDPEVLRHVIRAVREKGWASSDREIELGLRSIAVPIRNRDGKTVAALNTNSPVHNNDMKTLEKEYLPILQETARQISEFISWSA